MATSQPGTIGNVRYERNVGGQDLTDACSAKSGSIEVGVVVKEDDVVIAECRHVGGDTRSATGQAGGCVKGRKDLRNIDIRRRFLASPARRSQGTICAAIVLGAD